MEFNFDAMSEDDLMGFWLKYSRTSRAQAAELIGDRRKGFTVVAKQLANYASNKATAMACRVRGDIRAALVYEQICDSIYNHLPKDVRW